MMTGDAAKTMENMRRQYTRSFEAEFCQMIRDIARYIRDREIPPRMRLHVRNVKSVDVAALRRRLRMSRATFARNFGLDVRSVQQWERGTRRPDQAARSLLRVIQHNPIAVKAALAAT